MERISKVLRNTGAMAVGTVISRITGLLRTMVIVAALGFGPLADAYAIGNTLPNIIYILTVGGALNTVFIPQLVRRMKDDSDGGKAFTDRLLTATGLILFGYNSSLCDFVGLKASLAAPRITPRLKPAGEYQESAIMSVLAANPAMSPFNGTNLYTSLYLS